MTWVGGLLERWTEGRREGDPWLWRGACWSLVGKNNDERRLWDFNERPEVLYKPLGLMKSS